MDFVSRFFRRKDSPGYTYEANFTLAKVTLDHWLYEAMGDIRNKVLKRLEDDMYNKLKAKIVANDLLTTQVLNELRLLTAKKLIEK
jgi:hypothetical protein